MPNIPLHSSREADIFYALNSWFKSDIGLKAALAFSNELQTEVPEIFDSRFVLQLGQCNENPWLKNFIHSNLYVLSPYVWKTRANIMSSVFELPLRSKSMNCIIAPFTLQFTKEAPVILEEINRVLQSCGYVVFFGVNPFSVWGMFSKLNQQLFKGHKMKLYSALYIKQQLAKYGTYEHYHLSNFFYLPPLNNASAISSLSFLDEIGKFTNILPSAFYCLVLRKYDRIQKPLWSSAAFALAES